MSQKSQTSFLVGIVLVVLVAVAVAIILPQLASAPSQVEVVNTQTGETTTQVSYAARYVNIPHSRTTDGGFVLGNPDAPVTIVEFADFLCSHCQEYHETVGNFIDQYVATGKAKFEYRLFPIVSPDYSSFTAKIAECADTVQPGMFWAAHDMLFDLASRGDIDLTETPQKVANTLSLDAAQLTTCIETAQQYETDKLVGDKVGVSGTPAVLVRVDENTLGWAYLDGRVHNGGGLTMTALETLLNAENIKDLVVIPEPLLSNLVNDEACAAPCWRGITPGETTWSDATAAIKADRLLVNSEEQTANDGSGAVGMFWEAIDGSQGRMFSTDGTSIAQLEMVMRTGYNAGDVIKAQGDPTLATALEYDQEQTLVKLYYSEKRLIVYVFVDGITAEEFTAESEVIGASYQSQARFDELISLEQPVAWAGYEGFMTYKPIPTIDPTATEQPTPAS